ncbi:MAG: hypothetical protein IJS84_09840, partial [Spirochaetales bacterium]|nr:hypothetical protein [Spirochaetales bacterium]
MDYSYFEDKFAGQKTKVGIIGATRGYGYTIVVQLLYTPQCSLRLICSRHPDECVDVLKKVGYNEKLIKVCATGDDVKACGPDDILVVSDYRLIVGAGLNTVVECTGKVDLSSSAAALAIENGINVCMVSKETDSVCGPYLTKLAQEKGVIYTLANGDQPRNLADLCSWARALGLEIVCAGKSSENDIIYNPETSEITYLEATPSAVIPELAKYREFKGVETLKARYELLKSMLGPISADLCEMNLVSNVTGLKPAAIELNYPVARITELGELIDNSIEGTDYVSKTQIFYAQILKNGPKGKIVLAYQQIDSFSAYQDEEVKVGDVVTIYQNAYATSGDSWVFGDYYRIDKVIWVAVLFLVLLLVFGRIKGFN